MEDPREVQVGKKIPVGQSVGPDSFNVSGWGETGEKRTSGARDTASATQAEHCALHHTRVLYLSDGVLAILSKRKGGNLVDICTSCI